VVTTCWDTRWTVFAMVDVRMSTVAKSDVYGRSFDVNCDQHCLYVPEDVVCFTLVDGYIETT